MSLRELLFGRSGEIKPLPTISPEQQALMSQLMGGLRSPLKAGLGSLSDILSGNVGAYQRPAMRQFREQIVPGIAERFSGMGAGAQSSSAFPQALGQAGAGLAEQLAMQKAGLQQQGLGQLQSLLGMTMQPQFQYQQIPGTQGALSSIFGGLGSAIGTGLGLGGTGLFSRLFGG